MSTRVDDMSALTLGTRVRVEAVLERLRKMGHDPVVWETLRTPERGAELAARGRSKTGARSVHCLGLAADIICRKHRWDCPNVPGCTFFRDLGRAAKAEGLTWGGDWRSRDMPHVQNIPVRLQAEAWRIHEFA